MQDQVAQPHKRGIEPEELDVPSRERGRVSDGPPERVASLSNEVVLTLHTTARPTLKRIAGTDQHENDDGPQLSSPAGWRRAHRLNGLRDTTCSMVPPSAVNMASSPSLSGKDVRGLYCMQT